MSEEPQAGLRISVGLSGAGKTYGIRKSVERYVRAGVPVIVVDRMFEWNEVPKDLARYSCVRDKVKDGEDAFDQGARLVIIQCRAKDIEDAAIDGCRWARDWPDLAGIAIPEAHRVMPNNRSVADAIEDILSAWRHYRVALWADSQRVSLLSKNAIELAREIRVYAQRGKNDFDLLKGWGGQELVDAVKSCTEKLRDGEQGWHVNLGIGALPPFEPTRE